MKRKIAIIFVAIILTCSFTLSTIAESLTDQQKDIQKQIRENEDKLKEVEKNLSNTMKEVQALNSSIAEYQSEITKLNENLSNLENEIEETEQKLKEAQIKEEERKDVLEKRAIAMLKIGNTTYLEALLESSDMTEFVSKYYLIGKMADLDEAFLQEMEKEIAENKELQEKLEKKKDEVTQAKAEIEKKTAALKNAKIQKDSYVGKLNDEEKALQSDIEEYNKELNKVNAAIKEAERKAAEQAAANGGTASYNKYTGGTLAWPTRIEKRVNSIYAPGGRTDIPVSGSVHRGIDLYAPQGTPIYPAADGQVVYINSSGWGGGFGKYVVVSHGNGLYTLYAHGSGIGSISVGDTVTTDTVIMYAGSTGWSYGAHLHFEVCLGSTSNKVNPAPYLGCENKVGPVY